MKRRVIRDVYSLIGGPDKCLPEEAIGKAHTVLQDSVVSADAVVAVTISSPPPDQAGGRRSVLRGCAQAEGEKKSGYHKTFHKLFTVD